MGLFTRVAQILADYGADMDATQTEVEQGLQAVFDRGRGQAAQPDRFQREMQTYRDEVSAASGDTQYALVNGVWVDTGSAEYASWYDAQGWV